MTVTTSIFGRLPDGREAMLFTFSTSKGMKVGITNFGGIVTSIIAPDSKGDVAEVNAGFLSLDAYLKGHPYFGATVGRFANRIANGKFELGGQTYSLATNNGPNHLHGGVEAFHARLWDYSLDKNPNSITLSLSYVSPDMEEGYPGNLKVRVDYTVLDSNEIQILFHATTDKPTHVNLTNHCYFNLGGFKGTVLDHKLELDAFAYLPVDDTQIPTGEIKQWEGTPFQLSVPTLLEQPISSIPGGLDHCFALNQPRDISTPAARLTHEHSGRFLEVYCTQPGIQVYTGNFLDGSLEGHGGVRYQKHGAVCLETQHFPDSPNWPSFPSTLLTPEQDYSHQVRMVFGTL